MIKEFIPYEQALALKELGFDEKCFGDYFKFEDGQIIIDTDDDRDRIVTDNLDEKIEQIAAPLYQQAARYLYIKSNNKINIQLNGSDDTEELNRKIKQGIQDLRNLQNNKSNQ